MTVQEYQKIAEQYGVAAGRVLSIRQDLIWAKGQVVNRTQLLEGAYQELALTRLALDTAHAELLKGNE